jgi:hypothetical protein
MNLSNYTTLRVENEATLKNAGWEIESSLTLNQQVVTNVVLAGGQYYPGSGGFGFAPSDPSLDYLPVGPTDGGADAAGGQTAEEVRTADLAALFAGITAPNVRITRMRSDIAHAAMTADLVLQASADQSELSNIRTLTRGVNEVCACGYLDGGSSTVGGGPTSAQPDGGPSSAGGNGSGFDASLGQGEAGSSSSGAGIARDASLGQGTGGSSGGAGSSQGSDASLGQGTGSSSGGAGSSQGSDASLAQGPTGGANGSQEPAKSGGGSSGCAVAPASNAVGGLGALWAFVGLALARAVRARRRS